MVTSGVTTGTAPTLRQIIDHGFRRARIPAERVGSEPLQVAMELLQSLMAEWTAVAFPLWTRRYILLGIVQGSPDVPTPTGTMEVLHSYWRIINPYRGLATLSTGAGDMLLFGGQPNTDVTITGANPSVAVNFNSPTEVDTIGVLPGAGISYTAVLDVRTSPDGITWTTVQSLPSATYVAGVWTYFDLVPFVTSQFLRLQYTGASSWVLNQLQFGLANGIDIELGNLNIDDYYNLPNKQFPSDRPNSVFTDRKVDTPVLKIWPVPSVGAFYNGTVSALVRRYIQDPGTLLNTPEVPARWVEALQWRLAVRILDEIDDSMLYGGDQAMSQIRMQQRQQAYDNCTKNAEKAEAIAWGEERNKSPIRLSPNARPYTA